MVAGIAVKVLVFDFIMDKDLNRSRFSIFLDISTSVLVFYANGNPKSHPQFIASI